MFISVLDAFVIVLILEVNQYSALKHQWFYQHFGCDSSDLLAILSTAPFANRAGLKKMEIKLLA